MEAIMNFIQATGFYQIVHSRALGHADGGGGAVAGGHDLVLHLHGLQNKENVALLHGGVPVPAARNDAIPNRQAMIAAISAAIAEEEGADLNAIRILSAAPLATRTSRMVPGMGAVTFSPPAGAGAAGAGAAAAPPSPPPLRRRRAPILTPSAFCPLKNFN